MSERTKVLRNITEAKKAAKEAFHLVESTGKWMTVCFGVVDGVLKMSRTTFEFPRDDLQNAVNILNEDIQRELTNKLPDDPLPRASLDFVQDLLPVVGKNEEND